MTRALDCNKCGGPVSFMSAFCPWCRVPLTWSDVPHLGRGAVIVERQYGREPQLSPELAKWKGRPEPGVGVWFDMQTNKSTRGKIVRPIADVAATLTCIVHDSGGFGLYVRAHDAQDAVVCYVMRVRPMYRSYNFMRLASAAGVVHLDRIRPWEAVSVVRPAGQSNTIEVRCADSIFNLFVNDTHVATVVDARFGFGEVHWELSAYDAPSRICLVSASVHHVA